MKNLFFAFVLCCFVACDGAPKSKQEALDSFSEFIVEFCSDKEFQLSHIRFPLGTVTGLISNADVEAGTTTPIEYTEELWLYVDARSFKVSDEVYEGEAVEIGGFEYVSPQRIEFKRQGQVVGYLRSYGFEYVDGDWYLVDSDFYDSGVNTYEDCVKEFARLNESIVLRPTSIEEFDFSNF